MNANSEEPETPNHALSRHAGIRCINSVLFIIFAFCINAKSDEDRNVELLIEQIETLPTWSDFDGVKNTVAAKHYIPVARLAVKSGQKTTRRVFQLISKRNNPGSDGKLFLLNRLFFEFPDLAPEIGIRSFDAWASPPGARASNPMWPWLLEGSNLRLIGKRGGTLGPAYRPIGEFDYLFERFGVRQNWERLAKIADLK